MPESSALNSKTMEIGFCAEARESPCPDVSANVDVIMRKAIAFVIFN